MSPWFKNKNWHDKKQISAELGKLRAIDEIDNHLMGLLNENDHLLFLRMKHDEKAEPPQLLKKFKCKYIGGANNYAFKVETKHGAFILRAINMDDKHISMIKNKLPSSVVDEYFGHVYVKTPAMEKGYMFGYELGEFFKNGTLESLRYLNEAREENSDERCKQALQYLKRTLDLITQLNSHHVYWADIKLSNFFLYNDKARLMISDCKGLRYIPGSPLIKFKDILIDTTATFLPRDVIRAPLPRYVNMNEIQRYAIGLSFYQFVTNDLSAIDLEIKEVPFDFKNAAFDSKDGELLKHYLSMLIFKNSDNKMSLEEMRDDLENHMSRNVNNGSYSK